MNFGSLLGAVSRVLPGYMEGERQAVRDNWQDLQNYNNVQMGQLGNLFLEGTMPQRFQMFNDQANRSGMTVLNDLYNLGIQRAWAPARMYEGMAASMYAPYTAPLNARAQLQALMMGFNNPAIFMQQGGAPNGAQATTPWGVR